MRSELYVDELVGNKIEVFDAAFKASLISLRSTVIFY